MTVFAVFREGVYRHECGGIFPDEQKAIEAADLLAMSEPDDHHRYSVVPFELGTAGEPEKNDDDSYPRFGGVTEPGAVYEVSRSARPQCKPCSHPDYCHKDNHCVAISCRCPGWEPNLPPQPTLKRSLLRDLP